MSSIKMIVVIASGILLAGVISSISDMVIMNAALKRFSEELKGLTSMLPNNEIGLQKTSYQSNQDSQNINAAMLEEMKKRRDSENNRLLGNISMNGVTCLYKKENGETIKAKCN